MAVPRHQPRNFTVGRNVADHTLTLSAVEQAAVLNHLRVQYGHLDPNTGTAVVLDALLGRIAHGKVVALTRVEAVIILRFLRRQSAALFKDMIALEERRIRGGHNGHLENAHRALDADRTIIEDVIRRLWEIVV